MQNHKWGNPRHTRPNVPNSRRSPQGNSGIYGSYNQLDEIGRSYVYPGYGGESPNQGPTLPNGIFLSGLPDHVRRGARNVHPGNNYGGVRHNRTSSSSSDQSYQRRNNSGNFVKYQNKRGGGNFRNDNNQGTSYQNRNQSGNQNRNQNWNHPRPSSSISESRDDNASNFHRGRRTMGFKALQSLVEKDSEELILELSNSKKGFDEFLKLNLSDDAVVLFTKALKKVSDSPFVDTKYKVLQTYLDDPFVSILTKYITELPLQDDSQKRKNRYFWNNTDEFWHNVIKICEDVLNATPTFAVKVLPTILKHLHVYIPVFESEHGMHVSDEIKDNVRKLKEILQTSAKEIEEKQKSQLEHKLLHEYEEEPPDDFRLISVYPNSYELLDKGPGFLRRNIVKGRYKDVNQYLDIQFRLLREDFVGPLRSGIASYRSNDQKRRVENVKIYKKVRFLNPETINEHYCVRLQFDFTKKKKSFSYENSRKFMFGSLLCFTMDNFRTFLFGKVSERKVEDLEKGEIIVGFDENVNVLYNTDYTMIECSVFFEPYFHVLNVLKNMPVDNFPMEKYIINVDSSIKPPEYLTVASTYKIGTHEFSPLLNWPARNFYNLNDSQLLAFKAALTQEFTIIQGPPGTGKTFLGLKIAETLLKNKDVWYQKTPMLVICFTNHALDQFLEGILSYTNSIMRVGGQSKNEKLQSFNLRNRGRFKVNPAIIQQREEVQRILTKIKSITENLRNINLHHTVRAFDVFEDVVPNFTNSWFSRAKRHEILDWLFGGRDGVSKEEPVQQHNVKEIKEDFNKKSDDQEKELEDSDSEDVESDKAEDIDDIFEVLHTSDVQCSIPILTVKSISDRIIALDMRLAHLQQKQSVEDLTFEDLMELEKSTFEIILLKDQYQYLNRRLAEGKQEMINEVPRNVDLKNPNTMTANDRWNLYFYWLKLYKTKLEEKLEYLNRKFRESFKIYEEMRDIENSNIMKNVLVIGMTTTGAARLRSTLQTLKSPIVIVEEAAEVLEAHIVTSLTTHCKHLILIGDHQQLKPSTADFKIEKDFNLGISLFERMVVNNIQCYTLNVQHRMRPEIASLIRPTIYEFLEDHHTVLERPSILGVDNNLFFIDHTHAEVECEGTSKKNYHEVEFLIHFARHLILNGYKPENITILAAYLGQMFELQKARKKHRQILGDVRISVLDNYQGEECDIILLSLVRNNEANRIGFLSIENRVCVALSRAKNGLYIMGNMTQLCNASELWRKIKKTFEGQNALGTELPLRCQVHRETLTYVKQDTDFLAIPEGGCQQKCEADLVCGHKCLSFCHILDKDHLEYKCHATCGKKLCDADERHICKKMCYQTCGPCIYLVTRTLPCGHIVNLECHVDPDTYQCEEPVSTQLPCGHIADKPCHCDPNVYKCPVPCDTKVEPCGHACLLLCHIRRDPDHLLYKCRKPCAKYRKDCTVRTEKHLCPKQCYEECDPCTMLVQKARTICPHYHNVPCNFDVDTLDCTRPCKKILDCSHKCKNKCNEPCGKCEIKVDKVIPICGHIVKAKCSEEPNRKLCNKKCPLQLPCGHPCTTKCNEPCTPTCKVMVDCNIKGPCGHMITQIRCSLRNTGFDSESLLKYCNAPCREVLKCNHKCSGSCGQCSQGRIHKRCLEKCGVPLVCDHLCEFPCREACRPCRLNCSYECQHSKCRKKCGEVCTPCTERCPRRCVHQRCTKFCGQICDVPPCIEPCHKALPCGHQCIGFCGDPCPPKCLVCDKEELTEIFFGFEGEDARYLVLNDCGHVIENTGLEMWLQQDKDKISFKVCPLCKSPIKTTQRFSDDIKRAMEDVAKAKIQLNGTPKDNDKRRVELQQKLAVLKSTSSLLKLFCSKLDVVFETLEKRLKVARKGQRQPINKHELTAVTSKLQILEHIIKICCKSNVDMSDRKAIYLPQVTFILKVLLREEDFITNQEIDDINPELNRLSRIVEFSRIKKLSNFATRSSTDERPRRIVELLEERLFSLRKFSEGTEENIKELLTTLSKLLATGIGISENEKREIVTAMGFKKGHWYKCPNGHPYVIADCGGAMEVGQCNECKARIGGSNHRLLGDNAVASEMDGATHGAWSEAANMGNYNFRDLL